jgi:hypothetical protein
VGAVVGARDSRAPFKALAKMAAKAGFSSRFHILSRHPIQEGSPLFEQYAASFALYNTVDVNTARQALLQHYTRSGRQDFWLFFCSLAKTGVGQRARQDWVDLSFGYYGDWFV